MVSIKYSTRLVIIFNNVVVKIPISRRGFLQGLNEKKIWDKYKNITSLAELKWVCMGVVCQKRYNIAKTIPTDWVIDIKTKIPEFNFDNCDLHNPENWGIDQNKYVLLDYGVNEYIASLY